VSVSPDGGFPSELLAVDLARGAVSVQIDAGIYPLEAVYGAGYVFIDRAYVLIDRPAPDRFRVTISSKKGDADAAALRALVGEFLNELLSCAWRAQITRENRAVIEAVTMQAIGGAMGPPSLDELEQFDFTQEAFEDPLGIAMSWEEKYGKKDKPAGDKKPEGGEPK
jgi:His-Xaa-Ser system protein HxsD